MHVGVHIWVLLMHQPCASWQQVNPLAYAYAPWHAVDLCNGELSLDSLSIATYGPKHQAALMPEDMQKLF